MTIRPSIRKFADIQVTIVPVHSVRVQHNCRCICKYSFFVCLGFIEKGIYSVSKVVEFVVVETATRDVVE